MDMWDTPVLETERLLLRPFTEDDLPAVFAIFSDREVNRFLPWFPVRTMEEAESFFQERYAAAYRDRSAWKFAICLKRDDIPIGYVTLSGDDSHDLGYGLRRESWDMGNRHRGRAGGDPAGGRRRPALPHRHSRPGEPPQRQGDGPAGHVLPVLLSGSSGNPKIIPVIFRLYQLDLDGQRERTYRKYWDQSAVHFVEKEII